MNYLGIDLGGTKIEGIVLAENGKELFKKRVATPSHSYQAILKSIQTLVLEIEQKIGCKFDIGIGTPGAISTTTGLLKNSNTTCMNGQPFLEDIKKQLKRNVRIENDANCFALSEAVDGSAKNEDIVFGVIIGTGTGAGIVVNNQLLKGANGICGEWGHNPLPWPKQGELPGADCYCGKQGCIETWLSGPGMVNNFSSKKKLSSKEIVLMAKNGDKQANQYLHVYYDRLARALAHVINIIDPNCIVLGGGMSNIEGIYTNVPNLLKQYVFSDDVLTKLKKAQFGDSSGVRGAAWLWKS